MIYMRCRSSCLDRHEALGPCLDKYEALGPCLDRYEALGPCLDRHEALGPCLDIQKVVGLSHVQADMRTPQDGAGVVNQQGVV